MTTTVTGTLSIDGVSVPFTGTLSQDPPAGPAGPTGPAGSSGPTGPVGLVGAQGPTGSDGVAGATGPTGPMGLQGGVGLTGATGPMGSIGPTGAPGSAGAPGNVGPPGTAGAPGSQGPTGPTGPTGPAGSSIGPTGTTGPTGSTGPTGTATPAITGFAPTSGPIGTVITITGSGFTGATTQYSGLQVYTPLPARFVRDATINVLSDTSVQMTVPADAGTTNQIFVGNSAHTGWASTLFTASGTGPTGPTGATGPTGGTGPTGSTGPTGATGPTGTVTVTVSGAATPISPYIYGGNFVEGVYKPTSPAGFTLDRLGGDRLTAYNWTTNASNAGSDYNYENDANFPGSVPASAATNFIAADQAAGIPTIITFQMQGLVAGDEAGPCSITNPPDLTRFKTVQFAKGAPFTPTAPALTGPVYMDEFANAVDTFFAGEGVFTDSPTKFPVFGQLDNEPDLWSSTHKELGTTEPTAAAFYTKTIQLATALKTQYPQMTVFGAVTSGFYGLYNWNGTLATTLTGANWFVDDFCAAMKTASTTFGAPLVDVFDFHWYSQITVGGAGITGLNGASLTDAQVQAIVQSPRSLWDPTFTETSWITADTGIGPIALLPRFKAKIAAANPGMKMSITEYYNGGGGHIAGAIAQADNLGIFGAYGLFAACMWPLAADPFVIAGFRAYRNFDSAGSNFGDTSVPAASSNTANVAVYVSTDTTRAGRVVMVAINRSSAAQTTTVSGQALTGTAHLYQLAGTATVPVTAGTQPVSGTSLTVTLPPYSVTTIDCF